MSLKLWRLALTLSLIMATSGVVSGEDTGVNLKLGIPTTTENSMSTIYGPPIVYSEPSDGGATYHSVLPIGEQTANPFKMAVIGDSIAWGNGLNQEDKYYNQVAEWLRKTLNRPVEVTVYAHSGAVISGATGESKDPNLNSGYPTLMDQAKNIKDDVDLILVSGGINDVGIGNILDANTPSATIEQRSKDIINPMKNLLTYLLDETDAKIIVTGYYPLITEESNVELQDRAVSGALSLTSEKTKSEASKVLVAAVADPTLSAAKKEAALSAAEGLFNNVVSWGAEDSNLRINSDTFYAISTTSLETAVNDANKGKNRITFIDPLFQRENGYGASESFLWELNRDYTSNDDQYDERSELAKNIVNPITKAENKINSIGHPNANGALKYADLIETSLKSKVPDWLQSDATEDTGFAALDAFSIGTPESPVKWLETSPTDASKSNTQGTTQSTSHFQTTTSGPTAAVDSILTETQPSIPANPPILNSPGSDIEPGDIVDTLSPTFEWSGDPNADYYALYISKYPYGSANIIFDSATNVGPLYGTSFDLPSGYLQEGMKYRWNMKAHSSSGWSSVSDRLYFQISTSDPSAADDSVLLESHQDLRAENIQQCWSGRQLSESELASVVRNNFPSGIVSKTGENIQVVAYAVARAESSRNPTACGDCGKTKCSDNDNPSTSSIGLWQINLYWHPEYDRSWLFDPNNNAQAALEISSNGQDWQWWSTYKDGTSYLQWIPEAKSALGLVVTPESQGEEVTSEVLQNVPPNPPTLISPGSDSKPGDSINTLSPTFEWSGDPNADYYALYISKYPYGSANIIFDSATNVGPLYGTSFDLPSGYLQEGMKYRWNMKAHSSSGWSSVSDRLYFQTSTSDPSVTADSGFIGNEPSVPSDPPILNSPGSGSEPGDIVDTLSPSFEWSGDPNADYYALYISKYPYGSANIIFDSSINAGPLYGTSFNLPSGYLQEGMKYRWNMKAHSSSGWSSVSDRLYFQTPTSGPGAAVDSTLTGTQQGTQVNTRPIETSQSVSANPPFPNSPGSGSEPGDSINTLSPTFEWSGDPNADYYALYISKHPYGSANIIFDSSTNFGPLYGNSFNLPSGYLQEGMKYRWNMKAHSSSGWSSISNTLYFQTPTSSQSAAVDSVLIGAQQDAQVTLTLYVHEGSKSGPIIPGASVTGQDGSDNGFSGTTDGSGIVTLTGTPGTWSFTASAYGYVDNPWSQDITRTCTKHASIQKIYQEPAQKSDQVPQVTLTLYVHEGSRSGPIIPGASVTGQDGSGNGFSGTTDGSGIVTLTGTPGTWSFTASAYGYVDNPWNQDITRTCTKHASIQKIYQEPVQDDPTPVYQESYQVPQVTLTLYVHEGSKSGPIIPGASVTGHDGSGNGFSGTTDGSGIVTLTGTPGTWSFTASAYGYVDNPWNQDITGTCTKHAFLQK
jgi:hypothetical protein